MGLHVINVEIARLGMRCEDMPGQLLSFTTLSVHVQVVQLDDVSHMANSVKLKL